MSRRRPRYALATALVILAALSGSPPVAAGPLDGLRAPAVPDGRPTAVGAEGRIVHVVFFAAWCPPCVEELGALSALNDRWAHDDYRLVLVAVPHRQTAERLAQFVASREVPGQMVYDVDGAIRTALGADGLPTHLVFDSGGREVVRAERLDASIQGALTRLLDARRGR